MRSALIGIRTLIVLAAVLWGTLFALETGLELVSDWVGPVSYACDEMLTREQAKAKLGDARAALKAGYGDEGDRMTIANMDPDSDGSPCEDRKWPEGAPSLGTEPDCEPAIYNGGRGGC